MSTEEEKQERRWRQIHSDLRRMAVDGYLIAKAMYPDKPTEYWWIAPDGISGAMFSGEYGDALWKAAAYWGLTSTKRYTRKGSNGLVAAIEKDDLFKRFIIDGEPEPKGDDADP